MLTKKSGWTIFMILFRIALFAAGFIKQKQDPELRILNQLGFSVFISRGAGLVLTVDCAILLIPMCRNLLRFIRDPLVKVIPMDDPTEFHKQTAYSILLFTWIHTNAHYTNFFLVETRLNLMTAIQVHYQTWAGVTGHLLLLVMLLMYTSAHQKISRLNYELFWYIHHLFIVFYILLCLHSFGCFVKSADTGQCRGYYSQYLTLVGLLIYLVERLYREFGSSYCKIVNSIKHDGNVLEIQFAARIHYYPGQIVYLNAPEISWLQWHPFTITSCPQDALMSVHVSLVGDWTRNLVKAERLRVNGPFGAPAQDFYKYQKVLLVGTGIGITPYASILKSLKHLYKKVPVPVVHFIWICKDRVCVGWFYQLLADLEAEIPDSLLEIQIFITERMKISDIERIHSSAGKQDPSTRLKSPAFYGRPNWNQLLLKLKPSTKGKVGVFFCGAKPAIKQLRAACLNASDANVQFDFKPEHF